MKKRISLLVCVLVTALTCLTGCGAKKEADYDKAELAQVSEFIITYCSSVDEASKEELRQMRESVFEQQLAQTGLPMTRDTFLAAIEAWEAGENECGALESYDEFEYEASAKEIKVTSEAKFADRDATLEFIYDTKNNYLDSVTVSAHFTIGEILEKAGLNTLLGMGTVFVVLIIISLIISLFKYIPAIQEKFSKKSEVVVEAPKSAPVQEVQSATTDDTELIAVIAAAIAAAEGTSTDSFVVRSIKRRTSNKWV